MAVSPLVHPSGSTAKSPARSKLSSTAQAANGTSEGAQASHGGGHDLAEQMNEEEKRKYVKGPSPTPSAFSI